MATFLLPLRTCVMSTIAGIRLYVQGRVLERRWARLCRRVDYPDVRTLADRSRHRSLLRAEVAILGEFSAGKSSLVNALLGEATLPTGLVETTGVPATVVHGKQSTVRTKTSTAGSETGAKAQDLRSFVWDSLPQDCEIQIETPSPALRGLRLVDTPGTNTPNKGHRNHAEAVAARSAGWLYLTRAEQALRKSEIDWLLNNGAQTRSLIICLSHADRLSRRDRASVRAAAIKKLEDVGIAPVACLCVSNQRDKWGKVSHRRLLRVLRTLTRSLPCLALLEHRRAASADRKEAFRDGLRQMVAHLRSLARRVEAQRVAAETAARVEWLLPQKRQLVDAVEDIQRQVLQNSMAEYDRRRAQVLAKARSIPDEPPVLEARDTLTRVCRAAIERAGKHLRYTPVTNELFDVDVGLARTHEEATSNETYYSVRRVPGRGLAGWVIGLFKSDAENAQDLVEIHCRFIENERIRWATYVRERFALTRVRVENHIEKLADAETIAATARIREAEAQLSVIAKREDLVRQHIGQ